MEPKTGSNTPAGSKLALDRDPCMVNMFRVALLGPCSAPTLNLVSAFKLRTFMGSNIATGLRAPWVLG